MSVKNHFKSHKIEILAYFFLGIGFLFFPLIRNLSLESAAALSIIAAFYQILSTKKSNRLLQISVFFPFITGIPLLISDLVHGCFDGQGVLFWLTIPLTTVFLAQSIRRVCDRFSNYPRFFSFLILVALSFLLPAFEFLNSPLIYFYNPIWGYFPGPIYDELLSFPPNLLLYRFYILIWAVLLHELQRTQIDTKRVILFFITLDLLFLNFRNLGIIRTEKELTKELSSFQQDGNLFLHYDSGFIDSTEASFLLKEIRFHWQELQTEWETSDDNTVQIFLYNHPWQKKELTGAKYTQYTPVWLNEHQIHIDYQSFRGVIRHELAHVLAKNWSTNIIHANWNMGLVEGFATAADPDISTNLTLQEFVAAGGIPDQKELDDLFSFFGFYSRSSANGYFKTGALIQFMQQNGNLNTVKDAYAGNWNDSVFHQSFENWSNYLNTLEIDSTEQKKAKQIFSRPSLFDKTCPRKITKGYQLYDNYQTASIENDSFSQEIILKKGVTLADTTWNSWFRNQLAMHFLTQQLPDSALFWLDHYSDTRSLISLFDLYLTENNTPKADSISEILQPRIPKSATFWKFRNSENVYPFIELVYRNNPKPALSSSPTILHSLLIDFAIEQKDSEITLQLTDYLMKQSLQFGYIRYYIDWAHFLWMDHKPEKAKLFLSKLELAATNTQHLYLIQREYRLVSGNW